MSIASIAVSAAPGGRRDVAVWLFACCAMVFSMVLIGGITRLTESGLSMVEWRPLFGALPPFGAAEWDRIFALYRQTPQYQELGAGMTLAEFKTIYWWEYVHRLSGRLTGVVFLAPFVWFLARRRIDRRLALGLTALFALGGLQGLLGWYMVQSGLIDQPRVSPYRLTAHLALALGIYAALLRLALGAARPRAEAVHDGRLSGVRRLAWIALAVVTATILSGGFMAGTRAGWTYNTFPLMDGALVPAGYFALTPWYANPFENIAAVQFDHRLLAIASLALVLALWWRSRWLVLGRHGRWAALGLAAWVPVQVALGVATLLLVVPVPLAALHQGGAVLLFSLLIWLLYELRPAR